MKLKLKHTNQILQISLKDFKSITNNGKHWLKILLKIMKELRNISVVSISTKNCHLIFLNGKLRLKKSTSVCL